MLTPATADTCGHRATESRGDRAGAGAHRLRSLVLQGASGSRVGRPPCCPFPARWLTPTLDRDDEYRHWRNRLSAAPVGTAALRAGAGPRRSFPTMAVTMPLSAVTCRAIDYRSYAWHDRYPVSNRRIRDRPLVLLGPRAHFGAIYGPKIVQGCCNVVAVVDDHGHCAAVHGVERWTSDQFRARAPAIAGLAAVDLSGSLMAQAIFGRLLQDVGIERIDLVAVLAELDLPAVYQTPADMRERTIQRQEEWGAFRDALGDDYSRRTLDSILLLRLNYDRMALRDILTSPEDEYFSAYPSGATFRLRSDEIVCDAGAYIGDTACKVLAATGGAFRAIHAFEPDGKSFGRLVARPALNVKGVVAHHSALGDYTGMIRFQATGAMGSHVDEAGGNSGDTPVTRLDDALEEVSFIKMDLEGFEQRALRGAARLIRECRPRMAITGYHFADDLLDLWKLLGELAPDYTLRLRHHSTFYYDSIIYAEHHAGNDRQDRDAAF